MKNFKYILTVSTHKVGLGDDGKCHAFLSDVNNVIECCTMKSASNTEYLDADFHMSISDEYTDTFQIHNLAFEPTGPKISEIAGFVPIVQDTLKEFDKELGDDCDEVERFTIVYCNHIPLSITIIYSKGDGTTDIIRKDLFEKPIKAVISLVKRDDKITTTDKDAIDKMMDKYNHYLYFMPMRWREYAKIRNHLYFAYNLCPENFCRYLNEMEVLKP